MKRSDWKDAIKQPLGVIPGGSGNGLFSSLMHELGEQFKPACAGYVLAKGLPHPLDLTAVRNPHGESIYSFLSTEWAFIADADVESESLRALGGARFTVKVVQMLLFSKKPYEGEVWYLEEEDQTPPVPHDAGDGAERPGFDLFTGIEDGAAAPDGSHAKWKKVQSNFQLVWIMNLTHAASDAFVAPGAVLNDGYNYIVLMDETRPRKDLIAAFLSIENGKHVENDGIQFVKTRYVQNSTSLGIVDFARDDCARGTDGGYVDRAFKIVPAREDDIICVDGEVFKGPIEAQVHHNVARMVTLPRATSCRAEAA
jgi:sphingosine kinase